MGSKSPVRDSLSYRSIHGHKIFKKRLFLFSLFFLSFASAWQDATLASIESSFDCSSIGLDSHQSSRAPSATQQRVFFVFFWKSFFCKIFFFLFQHFNPCVCVSVSVRVCVWVSVFDLCSWKKGRLCFQSEHNRREQNRTRGWNG